MPQLVVRGPSSQEKRLPLHRGRTILLGRAPSRKSESDELLEVEWEPNLSRDHAELSWEGGKLHVARLASGRNPIFFKGEEVERFAVELGEHFVVGRTTFSIDRASVSPDDPTPMEVIGFTVEELRNTRYRNADERIELLSTLPEVLRGATTDEELFSRLVILLLEGIPSAEAVGIVSMAANGRDVDVKHWDGRRAASAFRPSRRLVLDAVENRRQSVRSLWTSASDHRPDYTMAESNDWAFCTPVPGGSCAGWGLYVAGKSDEPKIDLRPDVKFTELVADLLGAMRDFQELQRQQAELGRFFSPVTLPVLSSAEGEKALEPRQTDVSVLFCDLRGFSREAEKARGDLMELLRRVSRALDVMTHCIHSHEGVIGDFQGDAALAFWGWPLEGEHAAEACRAAVEIQQRFAHAAGDDGDPLAGFRCGIGIASGEAVAGRLGTAGQFKIDVFGPVVNLASRLEGITKILQVPLLVDEETVRRAHAAGGGADAHFRFRKLARLRPYGMESPVTVSELLPIEDRPGILSADEVARYEAALDAFVEGAWDDAFAILHEVPHWDHGKDFLTSVILRHQRKPPDDWDGVVALQSK